MLEKNPAFVLRKVAQLHERIELLKAKRVGTYFLNSYDLMWGLAESPEGILKFNGNLKAEILAAYTKLSAVKKGKRYQRNYSAIGEKMEDYIPEVKRLSLMSLTGSKLAFDLALYLGRHSYLDPADNDSWNTTRDPDEMVDELLTEMTNNIPKGEPDFKPQLTVDALRCEIEHLAGKNVQSYSPSLSNCSPVRCRRKRKRMLKRFTMKSSLESRELTEGFRRD
jgi:hypothetical protein